MEESENLSFGEVPERYRSEDNLDDFYGLNNYQKYMVFSRHRKLLMFRIKDEKKFR